MIDESRYNIITHYNVAVQIKKNENGETVSIEWADLNSDKCNQWKKEDNLL